MELPERTISAEEAEALFLAELRSDPDNKAALWNLALLYSKTDRHEEALPPLERLLSLAADAEEQAGYVMALGQTMEQLGDFPRAVRYYRQAMALEPADPETAYFVHNNLGFSLNQLGREEEAIPYLKTAISLDPYRANAFKNLGLAYLGMGHLVDAAEQFITGERVCPADPRCLAHLAKLLDDYREIVPEVRKLAGPEIWARLYSPAPQPSRRWWQFWK